MLLSKCTLNNSKNSKFIREHEAIGLLDNLLQAKISNFWWYLFSLYFVTSSTCGPFTKNKERIKKFTETGDSRYIQDKRKMQSFYRQYLGWRLTHMQLINKFNKVFRFLLCVIGIYSKYARLITLKDQEGITIINAFQKILYESSRKPNKVWRDKASEFYNRSMKSWLEKMV